MELPRRQCGDELLKPGEMARVLGSLRRLSKQHDISSVIVSAFDFHTRMLPLIWAGVRMVLRFWRRPAASRRSDSGRCRKTKSESTVESPRPF